MKSRNPSAGEMKRQQFPGLVYIHNSISGISGFLLNGGLSNRRY
jgi:hypothetical protein